MVNLQSLPIWLMWRYEEVKGKKTKVPYCARNNMKIGTDEKYRPQWVSFDEASDSYRAFSCNGVGFVIPEGYAVIDLDHASEDFIREIERLVDSYTEISPSGDGRHIIAKVNLADILWY